MPLMENLPPICGEGTALLSVGAIGVALVAAPLATPVIQSHFPPAPTISASVKITSAVPGHGSGVHIGQGLILTAAHVVQGEGTFTVMTTEDEREAQVLWASDVYDVALLRTDDADLQAMPLSCDTPVVGSAVTAYGNPLGMEFIRTSGQVIGPVGSALGIPGAYPVDMTIIPGMSGGPLVDAHGEVVGIAVAVMSYPVGFAPQLTGIGMAVSGEAVCELMGREA